MVLRKLTAAKRVLRMDLKVAVYLKLDLKVVVEVLLKNQVVVVEEYLKVEVEFLELVALAAISLRLEELEQWTSNQEP